MKRLMTSLTAGFACLASIATLSASAIDVPVYGQQWQPWGPHQLGNGPYTIGGSGCFLTSVTMIRDAFGDHKSPQDMNDWLRSHSGFSGSLLIPSAVPGYAGSLDYSQKAANLNTINSLLDQGYLVVAMTYFPPSRTSTHFVVLTGHSGNPNSISYSINDPWYGDRSSFNSRYGEPGRWIYAIHYYRR